MPTDDQPGYVVAEFRVNGDGWHHYYGWPDAPPGTPYKFTPRGTTIKELVYGSLSAEGLSPQPWEPREPGWGTHRIEYRGIDAAGNIGTAQGVPRDASCRARPAPRRSPARTAAISRVDAGVVCVTGTSVTGGVRVAAGAALIATNAKIGGAVTSTGASRLELIGSSATDLRISGSTDAVVVFGSTFAGNTAVTDNRTPKPMVMAGNTFRGAVACAGNTAPADVAGTGNVYERGATGQCAAK